MSSNIKHISQISDITYRNNIGVLVFPMGKSVLVFDLSKPEWRHNGCDGVSTHQPHDCLLNRLFRRSLKETSKLRVTGLYDGNSPVTGEFPAQMTSNAENASFWWRYNDNPDRR